MLNKTSNYTQIITEDFFIFVVTIDMMCLPAM